MASTQYDCRVFLMYVRRGVLDVCVCVCRVAAFLQFVFLWAF